MKKQFFTSESVCCGHPDKVADTIADAVLDEILKQDKFSRVACEVFVSKGYVIVAGEITTKAWVDINNLVREVVRDIGYTKPEYGFDYRTLAVLNTISGQSPDIARGVKKTGAEKQGAGDQGCIKKGSLVRTEKGFLPIEMIKPGDLAVTPYGLKKVINARMTGVKKIVEIIFSNGFSLECTPEHKILCYDKKNFTYWKSARDLTKEDFICILKPGVNTKNYPSESIISFIPKSQFFTKYNHRIYGLEEMKLNENIGYLTGELIGDGYVRNPFRLSLYFGDNFSHLLRVKEIMIDEGRLGKNLPFGIARFKKRIKKSAASVYDLEIEDVNIFSANGIFVHNSATGYACRETSGLMPLPIMLAHKLVAKLAEVRKNKVLPYLRPDGKSQVTLEYENEIPKRLNNVVIAAQHDPNVSSKKIKEDIIKNIIIPVCKKYLDSKTKFYINNTGRFVIGGPVADTGMSGRKCVVDSYGVGFPVGGGSFSGKDPTKVDRSGAYMARYIAKNIVASGLADKCSVRLSYVIGGMKPTEFGIETFGTSKIPEEKLLKIIPKVFDLNPGGIINQLNLLRPIYRKTACFGHFGREEPEFTWEKKDKVKELLKLI